MKKRVFRERNYFSNVVVLPKEEIKEENIYAKPIKKTTTKKKAGK